MKHRFRVKIQSKVWIVFGELVPNNMKKRLWIIIFGYLNLKRR